MSFEFGGRDKELTLYRAMFGACSDKKCTFNLGLSDAQLKEEGFLFKNGLQHFPGEWRLCVFLRRDIAEQYATGRAYREAPAVVSVSLPLRDFSIPNGRFRLLQNPERIGRDRVYKRKEILSFIERSEDLVPREEFMIESVAERRILPEEIRIYERIYRPIGFTDGELLRGHQFALIR